MNENQIIIDNKSEDYNFEINLINEILEKVLGNDNSFRKKLLCNKKINKLSLEFENFWSDIKNFSTLEYFIDQSHDSLVIQILLDLMNKNSISFTSIQAIRNNSIVKLKNMKQSGRIVFSSHSKYEILSDTPVGTGGNSHVFKVKHNGKIMIMKMLIEKSTEKVKRFKNEYWFSLRNKHKNIVNIIDQGVDCRGNNFIIMDKYNYDLRKYMKEILKKEKDIPEIIDILTIFKNILNGLMFLEQKGIVHRDIKPENILLNDIHDVIIADFGIAKFYDKYEDVETKKTDKMCNYKYAAPEQKVSLTISSATDVFAVGLMLNELFTGEVPQGLKYKKIAEIYRLSYLDEIVELAICNDQRDRIKLTELLNKISNFINVLENINNNSKIKFRTYYDINKSEYVGENSFHKIKGTTSNFKFSRNENHQVYPFSYMLFFEKTIFSYDFQFFLKHYNNVYWHECFVVDLNSDGNNEFVFIVTGEYELNVDVVHVKNNYNKSDEFRNIAIEASYLKNQGYFDESIGYSNAEILADGVKFEDYAEDSANYAAGNIDINIVNNKYYGEFKSIIFSIMLQGEKVFFLANKSKQIDLYVYLDNNFHPIPISFDSINYKNIFNLKSKKYKVS